MDHAALPNAIIIGAMKCATTAVHHYLAAHPDVAMSALKETNFFIGPPRPPHRREHEWWRTGQWHRGVAWYASLFDAGKPVRGESSPGYTSPSNPEAAARMADVIPGASLVYLVRDPLRRALSQYAHHRREGSERRPAAEALLDPGSQYIPRSRYAERLQPFLTRFPPGRIIIIAQERLAADGRRQLQRLFRHVGADPYWWSHELERRLHVGEGVPPVPTRLQGAFAERVADDVERLRAMMGDDLQEWRV